MIKRRLKQWMGFGLALAMSGVPAKAKITPKSVVVVSISMHNDAEVPWGTIRAAEDEASQVFREAGIDVRWVNCQAVLEEAVETDKPGNCGETAYPYHLQVRIARRSVGLSRKAMGIAFQSEDGGGCQADLFYEGIKGLQRNSNASPASILGYVAAHEIGHLLLGTNSHAPRGIMRAVWGPDELVSAGRRALHFSERESAKMRGTLGSVEESRKDMQRALNGYFGD